MPNVWFTSDLHLGHERVAELRGFSNVRDHDMSIAQNWVDAIAPGDQVWVLGDISSGSNGSLSPALLLLAGLPGDKHLISGNHDKCHPMHRDSHNWQRRYMTAFSSVRPFARRKIGGRQVLLSHFPYTRDRGESRHMQYRLRNEGLWLLHGHTHGAEKVTHRVDATIIRCDRERGQYWEESLPDLREIHVGLDAWGLKPVSLGTIDDLMLTTEEESS